ncbi:alpha/beta-hydrolase [Coprinellus micaceus]|uniref:Acyl-protein thioesterase 1 n=1 Tax=Coprinellus micaceus TaxID=71717 RepID=A0A4Y7TTT0_COPMI|nr:alpha/beta-hydrolase [Coprinellus micaceus]
MIPGVLGLRKRLSKELGGGIKFVLPHAPKMKVTGNFGEVMPSWFDCYSFDIEGREEDEEGIADAADWLNDFVDLELETCPYLTPARIVIGGLSQGGAVTCRTIVETERTLGGAFLLSTYVPLRKKVPELKTALSSTIPIFWGHGTLDAQVSFALALRSAKQLSADLGIEFVQLGLVPLQPKDVKDDSPHHSTNHQGIKLRFMYYGTLGHWFCDEELQDLAVWLSAILGAKEEGRKGGVRVKVGRVKMLGEVGTTIKCRIR